MSALGKVAALVRGTPRSYEKRSAAREAAREAAKQRRDGRIEELEAQIQAARETCDAAIAAEDAAFEKRMDELDKELAAAVKSTLYPLAARFEDNPRATARELAAAWIALSERCREELGQELPDVHLRMAFITARDPALALHANTWGGAHYRGASWAGRLSGAPAEQEHQLRQLELETARVCPTGDAEPELFALRQEYATDRVVRRLQALEKELEEKRQAPLRRASDEESRRARAAAPKFRGVPMVEVWSKQEAMRAPETLQVGVAGVPPLSTTTPHDDEPMPAPSDDPGVVFLGG